jgi:hypothetical protein
MKTLGLKDLIILGLKTDNLILLKTIKKEIDERVSENEVKRYKKTIQKRGGTR